MTRAAVRPPARTGRQLLTFAALALAAVTVVTGCTNGQALDPASAPTSGPTSGPTAPAATSGGPTGTATKPVTVRGTQLLKQEVAVPGSLVVRTAPTATRSGAVTGWFAVLVGQDPDRTAGEMAAELEKVNAELGWALTVERTGSGARLTGTRPLDADRDHPVTEHLLVDVTEAAAGLPVLARVIRTTAPTTAATAATAPVTP